jgi:hypothetical protein
MQSKQAIHAITSTNGVSSDIVIGGVDDLGATLRAIANDPFDSCAAAMARQAVSADIPNEVRPWLTHVLCGGLRVSTVKELARDMKCSARSPERLSVRIGGPTPNGVIELAQAAVAVLWSTPGGPDEAEIARRIGYTKTKGVQELVKRRFGHSLEWCRDAARTQSTEVVLAMLLRDRKRTPRATASSPPIVESPSAVSGRRRQSKTPLSAPEQSHSPGRAHRPR